MSPADAVTAVLLIAAGALFMAGTAGILRFPDVHSRLHALTKADNLGLGLLVAGLLLQVDSLPSALKLVGVWVLALIASASASFLIAESARAEPPDRGTARR